MLAHLKSIAQIAFDPHPRQTGTFGTFVRPYFSFLADTMTLETRTYSLQSSSNECMHLKFNSEFCERVSLLACLYIYIHIYIYIHLYIQSGLYVTLPQGGAAFSAWWPPWPSWASARPTSKTWIVQSISFLFCIYCRTKYVQKYNISDTTDRRTKYVQKYNISDTTTKPVLLTLFCNFHST